MTSADGAGCGARASGSSAGHPGGLGAPPYGQYDPCARSSLNGARPRLALRTQARSRGPKSPRWSAGRRSLSRRRREARAARTGLAPPPVIGTRNGPDRNGPSGGLARPRRLSALRPLVCLMRGDTIKHSPGADRVAGRMGVGRTFQYFDKSISCKRTIIVGLVGRGDTNRVCREISDGFREGSTHPTGLGYLEIER